MFAAGQLLPLRAQELETGDDLATGVGRVDHVVHIAPLCPTFPFAPHLGSEVYEQLTGRRVWEEPWPEADASLLAADVVELVVQLNGKLIDRMEMPADASGEEQEALARSSDRLAARLDGKEIVKAIVVPAKLVNFVAR